MPARLGNGTRVYLRPLERSDLTERYLGWLNDPETNLYLESGTFPVTSEDLDNFYREVTGSRTQVIFAIAENESNEHIGNVKLGPISWIHRRATFGILIGEKKYWGQGVGLEATRLAVEYGFFRLNLHRIDLGVCAEHVAAVRCYESAGFKVEGRFYQDLFLGEKYADRLWMGLLRSEYKPIRAGKRK